MHPEKNKLDQLKTIFKSEIWQDFFAKNLSDVIWIADLDLNYLYLSPSAGKLSGYESDEILKLTAGDILTPASMEKAMTVFSEELIAEKEGSTAMDRSRILEVEQVRKDGSTVWVELNVSFVRDDRGKPIGLFGITRDIDARKKAEEALQVEQQEKELILNNLAEQVAFLDPELRIIWANSKIIERHNLYDVDYKGQKCFELYHGYEQPCPDCPVVEAFRTGKTCSGVHQSPDDLYWQVTGIPVNDQNGEMIGVMNTALDITDLITSRQQLQESEAFARTVMDNLPLGLSVNSVDPEVIFNYMNDNFPKIYHTTREALSEPGAFWKVVYEDPQFRAQIKKRVEDDCASGDPQQMRWENVPITRDGQVVAYINATNTPVPDRNLMISTVWDVTDRVRAEKTLEENFTLLRLAGEKAKFGGWSVDLETNRCIWSDQVAIIHGMPIGYSPLVEEGLNFYAPEWREKIVAVFTACAEEGIPYDEEMQIITAKGSRVWVRTAGEAVRDESGKIIRVQGSFQDITERKKTEQALKKSEERLDLAMAVKNEGIWDWNLLTNETYFDKRYYTMAGYKPNEFPHSFNSWAELVHVEDLPKAQQAIDAYLKGKSDRFDIEFRFKKKDGQWMWINGKGKVYERDETGKPVRIIGTHTDITDRRQAEEALKEREEKYHTLFLLLRMMSDTMPDMLWAKDLDKKYIFANEAICKKLLLAKDTEEPVGKNDLFFAERERNTHPDNPEWHTFGQLCMDSDAVTLKEMKSMKFDEYGNVKGQFLYLDVHKAPLFNNKGELIGVVGSARDITDQKQAEAEILRLNEELEERVMERTTQLEAVNKELESFAYSVSHDFRAPLRALDGFSASLIEKYSDQLDEQGLHYLNRIRNAAIYMSNLVDDLLKLSRVTRTEIKNEWTDLSQLAIETLRAMQENEPDRKTEISVIPGLSAKGDPHLLQVLLNNLLGNAWKFSSQEKQAKIEVSRTVINGENVFFVRDNGVGFNMAYSDKLFGAFQRLHGVNEFPGTGIGLATVQRIINRHGGRIWAESEVGKGATFYFTLTQ